MENLGLLEVRKSKIRNAGMGCFAKTMIPAGIILGGYHGRHMTRAERDRVRDGAYIWKIHDNLYVDAKNHKSRKTNPLRYVNGAKTKRQQDKINCEVRFFGVDPSSLRVYYIATRNIFPGEELIISYGDSYF
jgi:hypothetical protein